MTRPRSGRVLAVPAPRAHAAVDPQYRPADDAGVTLPGQGPGVALLGHTHCRCGAMSPPLYTSRERRLWHTKHREEIAGVTWR
jgi:hypothetical protein